MVLLFVCCGAFGLGIGFVFCGELVLFRCFVLLVVASGGFYCFCLFWFDEVLLVCAWMMFEVVCMYCFWGGCLACCCIGLCCLRACCGL